MIDTAINELQNLLPDTQMRVGSELYYLSLLTRQLRDKYVLNAGSDQS